MFDMFAAIDFCLRHWKLIGFLVILQITCVTIREHVNPGAGSAQTYSFGDSGVTPEVWAEALLLELGDPATPDNVAAIEAWEHAEGGHWHNSAEFNPLNTTQPWPGSHPINSKGVQAYSSWGDGTAATVKTLRNGRYGSVLSMLSEGDCAQCVANAVTVSPWGTGAFTV